MKTDGAPGWTALQNANFSERLRGKDPSLWSAEKAAQKSIRNSLGWVTVPEAMAAGLGTIRSFVSEVRSAGIHDAVVLGMGGSSLACEVFRSAFPAVPGMPRLHVLDTNSPGAAARLERELDLARTLFIVSSKSGSTIEPNCLLAHFEKRVERLPGPSGARFCAITDPGTSLEKYARERNFRKVFLNPADIGGRYSALSYFGLVPAALMGVEIERLLDHARRAMRQPEEGLRLGAALGDAARAGRDKLSLSTSPKLAAFGLWVEQLVAESTGKQGRGILPVLETPPENDPGDRLFVRVALEADADPEGKKRLSALLGSAPAPTRFLLSDPHELGAQFFLWEAATAAAGYLLEVNPFDQPDVQSAKDRTNALLGNLERGKLPADKPSFQTAGMAAFADSELCGKLESAPDATLDLGKVLQAHWGRLKAGDYGAVLAFLDPDAENLGLLEQLRAALAQAGPAAVTLGIGPRYLHSTGQLHKGGNARGAFLLINETSPGRLEVPGKSFDFGTLQQAQARGDYEALRSAGRRVLRLDLDRTKDGLRALINAAGGKG